MGDPAMKGEGPAGQPAMRASGLSVGYGGATIVCDIDLEAWRGDVLGLIGPNGTGKSTLMRALAGLMPPSTGEVTVDGRALSGMRARERARRLAFLPQDTGLDLALEVREVVAMGRYAHRSRWRANPNDAASIESALERTGTSHLAERHIGRLSGGQRQLALIAKLLAQDASTLLLDEPVSALDLGYQLDVLGLMRDLADDGHAVIVVLHDLDLAARFCDRLLVLHDGRVRASGAPRDVLTPQLVRDVYRVEASVEVDDATGTPRVRALARSPRAS